MRQGASPCPYPLAFLTILLPLALPTLPLPALLLALPTVLLRLVVLLDELCCSGERGGGIPPSGLREVKVFGEEGGADVSLD